MNDLNAHVLYTGQSKAPILFSAEVLSTSVQVEIGGISGQITLPRFGESFPAAQSDHSFKRIVAPEIYDRGVLPLIYENQGPADWGWNYSTPGGESKIRTFLLEFAMDSDREVARNQMTQVFWATEKWFAFVREWLEALTRQDLRTEEPLESRGHSQSPIWSWSDGERWHATSPSNSGSMTMYILHSDMVVNLEMWKAVVGFANRSERPPSPYLLLTDARMRRIRDRFNDAVILSAIAVEVALKSVVENKLDNIGMPSAFIESVVQQTLGRIIDTCNDLSISIPPDLKGKVANPRNRAMHRNEALSKKNADEAIDAAEQVLTAHIPLPQFNTQ